MAHLVPWTALAVVLMLMPAPAAKAQSPYDAGYNAGYTDHWPISGGVNAATDYGRGFNAGVDDSYEDTARYQEIIRRGWSDRDGASSLDGG